MRHFILLLVTFVTCITIPKNISASDPNNIEDVLLQAQEEDKHIFVRFSASWCLPCQILSDQLSDHPEIVKEINDIYLEIVLDYDEPNHREWFVRYGVQCLPTMMVIDDMGQIIDRMDGTESIAGLEYFLHNNSKRPIEKLASKDLSIISSPKSNIPTPILNKKVESIKKVFVASEFSIQFGAFSSFENAQKLSNILLSNENINTVILEEPSNGRMLYKVRQTSFADNNTGDSYVVLYKDKGIDCMLKKT